MSNAGSAVESPATTAPSIEDDKAALASVTRLAAKSRIAILSLVSVIYGQSSIINCRWSVGHPQSFSTPTELWPCPHQDAWRTGHNPVGVVILHGRFLRVGAAPILGWRTQSRWD